MALVEIVLDTETTGLDIKNGHRIIEIACVKLIDRQIVKEYFHSYLNPEKQVDEGAYRIHGISNEFLKDKPQFSQISKEFLEFIGNHKLIIHNASFDKKFINNELAPLGLPLLEDNRIIDTLQIARRKFPGAQASLDALCKRFNLSLENRTKHGALIDAELLAMVYIMMHRNVQTFMDFSNNDLLMKDPNNKKTPDVPYYQYRKYDISEKELQKHQELLKNIKDPLWYKKAIV